MPVAVTLNVAAWPAVTVWLAGCAVIAGVNGEGGLLPPLTNPAHPVIAATGTNNASNRNIWHREEEKEGPGAGSEKSCPRPFNNLADSISTFIPVLRARVAVGARGTTAKWECEHLCTSRAHTTPDLFIFIVFLGPRSSVAAGWLLLCLTPTPFQNLLNLG